MILAGDVGGTKTLLGLFERAARRPTPRAIRTYLTNDFSRFSDILEAFARDAAPPRIETIAIGVAGPVVNARAQLTNIQWDVSAEEIGRWAGVSQVHLLNDLEAMANSIEALNPDELAELQTGTARPDGNGVVIAAGTGLGQAYLHRVGGRFRPVPSEGGHADFAARTDREIELLQALRRWYGRAEVEHILSGPGLLNLYRFTHPDAPCAALDEVAPGLEPAAVSQAGLAGDCPRCREALDLFVTIYGSEAGNLALRGVATGGVYVGGGIAPKILPALRNGRFIDAFTAKPPMIELLERMPVRVILNAEAALLGAAVFANER